MKQSPKVDFKKLNFCYLLLLESLCFGGCGGGPRLILFRLIGGCDGTGGVGFCAFDVDEDDDDDAADAFAFLFNLFINSVWKSNGPDDPPLFTDFVGVVAV